MKKSIKQESSRKPLYFLAAVLLIFVAYLLIKVVQKKDAVLPIEQADSTVEKINPAISLPTAKPIDLVANSKSEGPLVAKMSEKTTLDDLEKAIKFLPDGESFSCSVYSGSDKVEVLRIDKAKGKIRSVYIDGDYVDDLVGEQSSFNWSDYFINQAKAFNVFDYLGNDINTISDDMTLEEQVASLREMLNKIISLASKRGNGDHYPVISISGTPPTGISVVNHVNRCVSSGGAWNSFSSLTGSVLKSKVCSYSTDTAVQSKLSVLTDSASYKGSNCECPAGQCLNLETISERGRYDSSGYSTIFELKGYCSGGSGVVMPTAASTDCTSSGGVWTESGDSVTKYGYCTCPSGYWLKGGKCQARRGWGKSDCYVGQIDVGRFTGSRNSCFNPDVLESNCKANGGSWFSHSSDTTSLCTAESTSCGRPRASHFCGRREEAVFKQETCISGLTQTGTESCNLAVETPLMGCSCPVSQCLNAEGKCVADTFNDSQKETSCSNSGGTWKQFSNQYNLNSERCGNIDNSNATLWNPIMGCDCPAGKCLSDNKCVDGTSEQGACEQSGGVWIIAHDAPQYSYCQCPGARNYYPQATAYLPREIAYPKTCSQPNEVDCGTDRQCFYSHVQNNTKAKLSLIEVNYFDSYRTEESSQIQTRPKANGGFQTEIVMTVNSLKKIDEAVASLKASGVVSDSTLNECPNLINNLSQLEGKQAVCTVNTLSQAKALVENGLTTGNIARYGCSGDLLTKIKEVCGSYPEMTVKKPAVYLYPEKNSRVSVALKVNGEIVASEPAYPKNGWSVDVEPSGLINGRFDYLFYENTLNKIEIPKEGWIVDYADLSSWFDKNLIRLGLNEKEKVQFKEYWLNELKPANFYEIKLLSDQFLAENMQLKIDPKPDTVIRRNFIFKPLEEKIEIEEPNIATPVRNGFTVIEWGGVQVR